MSTWYRNTVFWFELLNLCLRDDSLIKRILKEVHHFEGKSSSSFLDFQTLLISSHLRHTGKKCLFFKALSRVILFTFCLVGRFKTWQKNSDQNNYKSKPFYRHKKRGSMLKKAFKSRWFRVFCNSQNHTPCILDEKGYILSNDR